MAYETTNQRGMTMRSMWKGTVVGVVALLALASSALVAHAVCGDRNGNGSLTIADCVQLFDVIAGPPDPSPLCGGAGALQCGDLNADGTIGIADGVICLNAVAGNETLFPLCTGSAAPIACPGGTAMIASNINTNQTWPSTCTILLDGTIFVSPNVVLTIQPGTVIKGKKNSTNSTPSALIFQRDSKINAAGTAAAPIVFTSDQASGSRGKGDWGGVMLNGRAPVNVPGGEGLAEGLSGVPFGGTDPNDSSGVVRFVRIEFAGRELSVDNELNLFTQNAVGAGTTIDHLQAHVGLDDCIEWFGGTVNSKFLVASGCGDDGLDWQLGTTGAVQFALQAQYLPNVEPGGSNGFEGDNNENGHNLLPLSTPKFCNVTALGTNGQTGTAPATNMIGMLLRRGTGGTFANMIVAGYAKVGMELRDNSTSAAACTGGKALTGDLTVRNSIFFSNGPSGNVHCGQSTGTNTPCTGCELYDLWANSQNVVPDLCGSGALGCQDQTPVVDPLVSLAWPPTDPRPGIGSPAGSGGTDCSLIDPFFTPTAYKGAFEPGGTNWLETPGNWINFATN